MCARAFLTKTPFAGWLGAHLKKRVMGSVDNEKGPAAAQGLFLFPLRDVLDAETRVCKYALIPADCTHCQLMPAYIFFSFDHAASEEETHRSAISNLIRIGDTTLLCYLRERWERNMLLVLIGKLCLLSSWLAGVTPWCAFLQNIYAELTLVSFGSERDEK